MADRAIGSVTGKVDRARELIDELTELLIDQLTEGNVVAVELEIWQLVELSQFCFREVTKSPSWRIAADAS